MRFIAGLLFLCSFASAQSPNALLSNLPLRFEEDARHRWVARGIGYAIGVEGSSATLIAGDRGLRLRFEGASDQGRFVGSNPLKARANYFTSDGYHSSPLFARLERENLYGGIGLAWYGTSEHLEYDFNLKPGADPSQIRMRFEGADSMAINNHGEIVLSLGKEKVTQRIPVVYQKRASGEAVAVEASYVLHEGGSVGLRLGAYDPALAMVVDPQLVYSAFLGGTGSDIAVALARDSKNNIYVGGQTYSFDLPFGPVSYNFVFVANSRLAFVMVLNATGPAADALRYTTFYGGPGTQSLTGLAADNSGKVYLTGMTDSVGLPISTVHKPFQTTLDTNNPHPYVAVIDTNISGSDGLIYATYLGGNKAEQSAGIATANGFVYATGWTSADNFQIGGTSRTARIGGNDIYVTVLDPNQTGAPSMTYSALFGGTANDIPRSIAADGNGRVYVSGYTFSSDFPTTDGAYQQIYSGAGDAFLMQIDPGSDALLYSTFVGGTGFDELKKVLPIPGGQVALAGYTLSNDYAVTQNAVQPVRGGIEGDAVLTVLDLNARGQAALVYSTFFGGSGGEVAYDLRRDAAGRFYICGYTLSSDFPVTNGALNPVADPTSGFNGFTAVINPNALPNQALVYSSYITGPGSQIAYGIEVDDSGNVFVAGYTTGNIFPAGAALHSSGDGNFDPFLLGFKP